MANSGTDSREVVKAAYSFFNARDLDAVLKTMHEDVDWPNGMEGGRVHGHAGVRDYWTRQWEAIDPRVDPVSFSGRGGGVVAVDTGPDVYLFGGGRGYDRGHDVHDYSHRGFVSHSAAHVGGGAHRR